MSVKPRCSMAGGRLTSLDGAKWCLCWILLSIQMDSAISQPDSANTSVTQATLLRTLFSKPFSDSSRNAHVRNGNQTEPAWRDRAEEKPQGHMFTKGTTRDNNFTTSVTQVQSSPAKVDPRNSTTNALLYNLTTISGSTEVHQATLETGDLTRQATRNARTTTAGSNNNAESGNNGTTVTQPTEASNQTVSQVTNTTGMSSLEVGTKLENVTFTNVTDRKSNNTQDNFTTIKMEAERKPSEQLGVFKNSSGGKKLLNENTENMIKARVDQTPEFIPRRLDFTSEGPENNGETTTGSRPNRGLAMESPLSAFVHHSTSLPLFHRETRKSSLPPQMSSTIFIKSRSFDSKIDLNKRLAGEKLMDEDIGTSKISPLLPSTRLKSLTFRPSNTDASSSQTVMNNVEAAGTSPRMQLSTKEVIKDQQGTATNTNDYESASKITPVHEFNNTEHRETKRKSTGKVRRSTKDPEDDDSTLPSSRRRSNEEAQPEPITPEPASHFSKPASLKTRKRHVAQPGSRDFIECTDQEDKNANHSVAWSSGSTLTVTFSGDGEALEVMWEIKPANDTPSTTSHRHVRDTNNRAAPHFHNAKRLDVADVSSTAKVNANNDIVDEESPTRLINGFVVSYRIPEGEVYNSSRLRANVRYFVLHQLHSDKNYIICVHAMSGQDIVHKECGNWLKSLVYEKTMMGVLAGALFFLPCVIVIIIILRKDKQMRAKHGTESGTWHLTNPSLVRAFATCEESHEALVKERQANPDRYAYLHKNSATNAPNKSHFEEGSHSHVHKPAQRSHTVHRCAAYDTDLAKDSSGEKLPSTRDSTKNLIEADSALDRELPLLHDILEDSTFCNPSATIASGDSCASLTLPLQELNSTAQTKSDRESNI
ncbi:hypothetical protein EGW08_012722 [Elysia chlorotica]|uniref:Fibronectin type-III domain-containing protein n=1 Tax=Elysia chlorotica TaxID=188477 RepID=A0A3S1C0E3_ELYCH|nr:hypothetical protein EGW08_012722 [Elysia chlorotica]